MTFGQTSKLMVETNLISSSYT